MKKSKSAAGYFILSIIILFISNSISLIYAQSNKLSNYDKIELMMANYEKALNSDNEGLRMCTVEFVGKFNMSNFEDKLVDMLKDEQNTENKKIIAFSLFQLGSLNSIAELRNSFTQSNDDDYKEFCSGLLEKYKEYDKLKSEYFESLVVNMPESE
ncbi:MAG: hypothetical protein KDC90_06610 [Ignavibacteriae bacterium]|nr:hypothetical protein [Ignavibacteriota bacterium]MCB9211602.1 hypothetical protein [Ignavibacteriales bacterium]